MRNSTIAHELGVRNVRHTWHIKEYMQNARATTGGERLMWVRAARIAHRARLNNQRRINALVPPQAAQPQLRLGV